jgi:membrane-bound lytic murein transglycosylase A
MPMAPRCWILGAFMLGFVASGGVAFGQTPAPLVFPGAQYEPVEWSDLNGWTDDDHAAAFATFLDSCTALTGKHPSPSGMTEITVALRDVCERAQAAIPLDDTGARRFFEQNFRPLQISKLNETDGFLTGYYEPIIDGSRVPTGEFHAPLYRRPPNLVASGWRKLGDAFPSKGVKVGRRFGRRKIVPYYTRGEIEDGALDGWHREIGYLRSQLDVQYAQIQGSARIRLEDGSILRVNYDSHNGWPYVPVGRVLIDRGYLARDQVSMQSIRRWMETHTAEAKDVLRQNKSYVFFRVTGLSNEEEAVGAEGVPLVPGRSIAVDRALHTYGTPFFINANLPMTNDKATTDFARLVVAQDTGSAIVGPARADIYFGAGNEAARMAGRIKNSGRFYMLLPRALDPVQAGRNTPLPLEPVTAAGFAGGSLTANEASPAAADPPPEEEEKPDIIESPAPVPAAKPVGRRSR